MKELFSLGSLYPSDFLRPEQHPRCQPVEMKLMMTDYGAVRLEKTAPPEAMYGKYWYRSGINNTMRRELEKIVESITEIFAPSMLQNDIWLDIACNDGTLLSYVSHYMKRIGIDPADNSFKQEAEKHGEIIQDYFSADSFYHFIAGKMPATDPRLLNANNPLPRPKAKVITSIAMFYDLDDPEAFIRDVHQVLDDDGLWVMQLSYTPLMLQQVAFDNICHEHIYYYSLFNLKYLLEENGFRIMDCQLNDVNGGSMRVYIMKQGADYTRFGTRPYRDVCDVRFLSLLEYERGFRLPVAWDMFWSNIQHLKKEVVDFITRAKADGKTIWGYGASTKGNTLLQYFGLNRHLISGIADRSEHKWGLRTVGTDIPIYSEAEMRKVKPDYLLVLPWHFINEFVDREKEYLEGGGKFIVPCPKFEIIGK